jgi:hypothetical protein
VRSSNCRASGGERQVAKWRILLAPIMCEATGLCDVAHASCCIETTVRTHVSVVCCAVLSISLYPRRVS